MKCPRCEQDNPLHAEFCLKCGTPVDPPAHIPKSYADLKDEIDGLKGENEELRRSLRESLDQQTATGEILRVIAGSPADYQPVFDTIVRSAVQVCRAVDAFWRLPMAISGRSPRTTVPSMCLPPPSGSRATPSQGGPLSSGASSMSKTSRLQKTFPLVETLRASFTSEPF